MKKFPWQILLNWFDKYGKHDFPWRQYNSRYEVGYQVWLAEILLQQTQADRVVPFYTKILRSFPTIQSLANTSYDEFFPYYQGLGYYSRARNLLKTASIINGEYSGVFPEDKSLLKKLPGVGEYTARAILAFGYKKPILAWDTNLETIFSRYYHGGKQIKLTQAEKDIIEADFRNFIGRADRSGSFSLRQSFGTLSSKQSTADGVGEHHEIYFPDEEIQSYREISRNINNALMDWARLMEPKNASLLDPDTYIFTESEFYISNGNKEIIEKKISNFFPIPDAQIIVYLHQDHQIYYSTDTESYSPFILTPSLDRDTRKYIQDYFRDTHGLELSVRPVHKKWITEDGKPYIAVNAQIQAGNHTFSTYTKQQVKKS